MIGKFLYEILMTMYPQEKNAVLMSWLVKISFNNVVGGPKYCVIFLWVCYKIVVGGGRYSLVLLLVS